MATKSYRKGKTASRRRKKNYTKFLAVFRDEVELNATKANKEIAEQIADEAVEVIESQRYRWKPLSEEYKARKQEMGYDERIYIRTGEFVSKIDHGEKNNKVWTGIPPDAEHTGEMARSDEPDKKSIPMWLLARFLEFGTKTIPPRPLWRPLIAKYVRSQVRKKFAERYRKALREAIGRYKK